MAVARSARPQFTTLRYASRLDYVCQPFFAGRFTTRNVTPMATRSAAIRKTDGNTAGRRLLDNRNVLSREQAVAVYDR